MGNNIPVEIDIVTKGDQDAVQKLNAIAKASNNLPKKPPGGNPEDVEQTNRALDHLLSRLGGANRETILLARSFEFLREGKGIQALGGMLTAGLPFIALAAGAGVLVKALEEIEETGKKAFEEVGIESGGFFDSISAGLGWIDLLNEKLEKTADVTKRTEENFARFEKRLNRDIEDIVSPGPNPRRDFERKKQEIDDSTKFELGKLDEVGKDLEERRKKVRTLGVHEFAEEWKSIMGQDLPRFGVTDPIGKLTRGFDAAIAKNTADESVVRNKSEDRLKAASKDYEQSNLDEHWKQLQDKVTVGKLTGRRDLDAEFITQSSWADITDRISKSGLRAAFSPEQAYERLQPLFKPEEGLDNKIRERDIEDAVHPRLAGGAVAGSVEFYKEYADINSQDKSLELLRLQLEELRRISEGVAASQTSLHNQPTPVFG